jgi:hypothetical protein
MPNHTDLAVCENLPAAGEQLVRNYVPKKEM